MQPNPRRAAIAAVAALAVIAGSALAATDLMVTDGTGPVSEPGLTGQPVTPSAMPTSTPAMEASLTLRGDGIGPFRFGAKQVDVDAVLSDRLGDPEEGEQGIIEPLVPTLGRPVAGRQPEDRLLLGPRGGVIHHRDSSGCDAVGRAGDRARSAGSVRHGLRHTALTWMVDAGVDLHILQRVAGHQDPAVTARYLHPDVQAMLQAGAAFSAWWSKTGPKSPTLTLIEGDRDAG